MLISGSIGQPFASDAFQCATRAHFIAHAKRNAIAVPKVELGQIAVQVLLSTVLINALHAALEDRVVALDCVRVNRSVTFATHVFIVLVANAVVARNAGLILQIFIPARRVGHDGALAIDVGADDREQSAKRGAIDMEATR